MIIDFLTSPLRSLPNWSLSFCLFAFAGVAMGQHADVLVSSNGDSSNPQLILAAHDFADGESFADIRLFEGFLEEQTFGGTNFYSGDEPGMNGITAASGNLPTGYQPLGAGDVYFDVTPFAIGGSTAELFLWDASSNAFAVAPSDYSLQLESTGAIADASASNNVATSPWATADADGFFHQHRDFQLLDGDADPATRADSGVYLVGLTARQAGMADSLPFYLVLGAGLDEDDPMDEEFLEGALDVASNLLGVMAVEHEHEEVPEPSSLLLGAVAVAAILPLLRGYRAA